MASAWRNFKNIFSRPLFTIIVRPKIVVLDTDFILRVKTMYESVKYVRRVKGFKVPSNFIFEHIAFEKYKQIDLGKFYLFVDFLSSMSM